MTNWSSWERFLIESLAQLSPLASLTAPVHRHFRWDLLYGSLRMHRSSQTRCCWCKVVCDPTVDVAWWMAMSRENEPSWVHRADCAFHPDRIVGRRLIAVDSRTRCFDCQKLRSLWCTRLTVVWNRWCTLGSCEVDRKAVAANLLNQRFVSRWRLQLYL